MIVFDINSWHYKLILYTFGKNFFLDTSELDWKAIKEIDSTKLIDMTWNNYPRIEKPKTVNLCPYCRAVVASTVLLPLVFLWRLFPYSKSCKASCNGTSYYLRCFLRAFHNFCMGSLFFLVWE